MKIPADMHKWRRKFAWQMAGYAVLLFFMSGVVVWQTWFYRSKIMADPGRLLGTAIISLLAAVAVFCAAIMCIRVIFSMRRHDAKMRELQRNRLPLTLERYRKDLGSDPEVEAELARLRAFNESIVKELKANS